MLIYARVGDYMARIKIRRQIAQVAGKKVPTSLSLHLESLELEGLPICRKLFLVSSVSATSGSSSTPVGALFELVASSAGAGSACPSSKTEELRRTGQTMCATFGKSWSGNPESGSRKLHPSSLASSQRRLRRWCHSRHQTSTIVHTLIPKAIFFCNFCFSLLFRRSGLSRFLCVLSSSIPCSCTNEKQ